MYNLARDVFWAITAETAIGFHFKVTESSKEQTGTQSVYAFGALLSIFAFKALIYKYFHKKMNYYEDFKLVSACTALIPAWNFAYDAAEETFVAHQGKSVFMPCIFSGIASGGAEIVTMSVFDVAKACYLGQYREILSIKNAGKFLSDSFVEITSNSIWQVIYTYCQEARDDVGIGETMTFVTLGDIGTRIVLSISGSAILKFFKIDESFVHNYTCAATTTPDLQS